MKKLVQDFTLRLPPREYKPERQKKNLIVLHHTTGGSARSTFDWWLTDPKPIGTSFLISRSGTIHQIFPPQSWAYHLGYSVRADEKRSIGIELACEGALTHRGGYLYCYDRVSDRTRYRGKVFDLGRFWRGYRYFATYSPAQIAATVRLIKLLLALFPIPPVIPRAVRTGKPAHFSLKNRWRLGILAHAHLRQDKTDVGPGFPWDFLAKELKLHRI